MCTGPVGPVEVFFYWPEAVFGNFYWPGAIGSPLASSPEGHGNYMMMKKFNDMLEIDILRNSSQKNLGVLTGAF